MINNLSIDNIDINIHAEVGTNFIHIGRLLQVGRGGIIPLVQNTKAPIRLMAGNITIAEGVLEIQDNRYVIRISKMIYKVPIDSIKQ